MCWNRFLGASVNCCRIEEISASGLSLECRSLARRLLYQFRVGRSTAIRFHLSRIVGHGSFCFLPYTDGVPR